MPNCVRSYQEEKQPNLTMNYCVYPLLRNCDTTPTLEECGEPASVKMRGNWLCERHYDMVMDENVPSSSPVTSE